MNFELKTGNNRGFTLIEILVVSAILFTVGTMVVQMFFSSMKGGVKSTTLTRIKENGDYALTVMERIIRNGKDVTCTSNTVTTRNPDDKTTTLTCLDGRIASNSAATGNYTLTSSSVAVVCGNIFDCSQFPDRKITINFTITQAGISDPKIEETANMNFKTTVTLRNYNR